MSYRRFAATIATSTVIMFGLMYLNTYALSHVEYSQTRNWMALVMGAAMALIMIAFMWGMYKNRRANIAIAAGWCWCSPARSGWCAARKRYLT